MNNVTGFEIECRRYFGSPRGTAIERAAIVKQLCSGSTVDGTINTCASQKRFVGCVYNGIGFHKADVASDNTNVHNLSMRGFYNVDKRIGLCLFLFDKYHKKKWHFPKHGVNSVTIFVL